MIYDGLMWLLLVPFLLSAITVPLLPKLNSDFDHKESLMFAGFGFLIAMIVIVTAFFVSRGVQTMDTEVWNGRITGKTRDHGTYEESYSCNCRQTCSGSGKNKSCSQTCDTCYRTHYTVEWDAHSTIGDFRIDKEDSTSRSVYLTPDPAFYSNIETGEACSKTNTYTNYIKAVPHSLYRPASGDLKKTFAGMLPDYPLSMYHMWRLDRVIPVKLAVPDVAEWNKKLANMLKDLGNRKQVNAVIVLANTDDETYAYALQDHWINGKKNDVILIIGAPEYPSKARWVKVLALTDRTEFAIRLESDVSELENLTSDAVISILSSNIEKYYVRKPMKNFDYLDVEIDPPMWVNVSLVLFCLVGYVILWIVAVKRGGFRRPVRRYGIKTRSRFNF